MIDSSDGDDITHAILLTSLMTAKGDCPKECFMIKCTVLRRFLGIRQEIKTLFPFNKDKQFLVIWKEETII